jgi:hypothetical protein
MRAKLGIATVAMSVATMIATPAGGAVPTELGTASGYIGPAGCCGNVGVEVGLNGLFPTPAGPALAQAQLSNGGFGPRNPFFMDLSVLTTSNRRLTDTCLGSATIGLVTGTVTASCTGGTGPITLSVALVEPGQLPVSVPVPGVGAYTVAVG